MVKVTGNLVAETMKVINANPVPYAKNTKYLWSHGRGVRLCLRGRGDRDARTVRHKRESRMRELNFPKSERDIHIA